MNAIAKMVTKATESQTAVSTDYYGGCGAKQGDGASDTTFQRHIYAVFCEAFIGNIFFSYLNQLQLHHDCRA